MNFWGWATLKEATTTRTTIDLGWRAPAWAKTLATALFLAFIATAAVAQDGPTPTRIETTPASSDPSASVPLRDFQAAKIEALDNRVTEIMGWMDRFVTQRFDLSDKAVAAALAAAQKAADKAEEAQALRNIVGNEFRGSLEDLSNTMARRDWAEDQFKNLSDRLDRLSEQLAALDIRIVGITSVDSGRESSWVFMFALLGAAGTVIGIVGFFLAFRNRS